MVTVIYLGKMYEVRIREDGKMLASIGRDSRRCAKNPPRSLSISTMADAEEIEQLSSTLLGSFQALAKIGPPTNGSP